MIIVVTGPREWTDYDTIYSSLAQGVPLISETTLVEGEAEGFDKLCRRAALELGMDVKPMPIETWYPGGRFDPLAGHKRNQAMIDWALSTGDTVVGFAGIMPCTKPGCRLNRKHNTHGTADCIKRLVAAKITTRKVYPNG